MIHIRTPSRLHFGLIAPAANPTPTPPRIGEGQGRGRRRFGGVGLMIDRPGVEVTLEPASAWLVRGPLAERGQAVLDRLLNTYLGTQVRPHVIHIERAAPEHVGLGTGTQLALAIARGLAEAAGLEGKSAVELAPLVGRGLRSAIGTHGFDRGGFLVDGGRADDDDVAPLVAWLSFPEEWRIILILPPWQQGMHGMEEREAFNHLVEIPGRPEALCRIVLLELLPALSDGDFASFEESLHQFNRAAGEAFAAIQGGPYTSARVAQLIDRLRQRGIRGVGQSSWGPAVFAFTEDENKAGWISAMAREDSGLPPDKVLTIAARNRGAEVRKR